MKISKNAYKKRKNVNFEKQKNVSGFQEFFLQPITRIGPKRKKNLIKLSHVFFQNKFCLSFSSNFSLKGE